MITPQIKSNRSGLTLIEVIVVIIILAVIASAAIPKYTSAVEVMRSREGVSILTALMSAQKRYALENAGAYTATLTDLDITIPAPANFNAITNASLATANPIATVVRNNNSNSFGNYTLTITDLGVVACSGGSGSICTKIGY